MSSHFDLAPAEWTTLRRLLQTAIELDSPARAPWIDSLSSEYEALKPRLRTLLAHLADVTALARFDAPPRVETAQFLVDGADHPTREGDRVGPYRLVRALGEGGMGTVWLAERTDMLQGRPVALKLPRGAWRRAGLAERLAREREILATLDHANIARLYDAGVADDGQPYLALEYVEGERIDTYCARKGLDVRARLQLFLQVARAVAHAHANLVVHRDLKPANILVREDGAVRLLDFGIAKLLEHGSARETELTQAVGRVLTPDYAAPEQIAGEPISTSTDVYALGVVLFELLTGARPYELRRDSRAALEDAILDGQPLRPSAAVSDPRLRKALRGDLDTIILQALKKRPSERYATVDAFAADIERHLQQRPVLAQPDSRMYRLRKFVARNRLAAGACASVLIAILVGASAAVWQARVARAEQQRADAVKEFIASIFRDASPWIGPQQTLSAVELLTRARTRVEAAPVTEPATRIDLLNTLGESFLGMQATDAALEIADQAIAASVAVLGSDHPQTLRARSLRFQALRNRGRTPEMRSELETILAVVLRDPGKNPRATVTALNDRAELELDEGKYAAAEATARDALGITDRYPGRWAIARISLWKAIAAAYESRILYREALAAAEQSYRQALFAYEGNAKHPHLINTRLVYARTLSTADDYAAAIPLIQQSIDDTVEVFGADSRNVGMYAQNLAVVRVRVGELAAARAALERALPILARHYGTDSAHYGAALDAAGYIALTSRRPAEAIEAYDRALVIVDKHYGPTMEHALTIRMRRALAEAYAGRIAESSADLEAVAGAYRTRGFAGMARPLMTSGEVRRLAGEFASALELQRAALQAVRPGPSADRERMPILVEIGIDLVELQRYDEALAPLQEALQLFATKHTAVTPQRADAWLALARAHLGANAPAVALPLLEQADAFWRGFDPESRWCGEAAFWLARAYAALDRPVDARDAFARAERILAASPFPADARLLQIARAR